MTIYLMSIVIAFTITAAIAIFLVFPYQINENPTVTPTQDQKENLLDDASKNIEKITISNLFNEPNKNETLKNAVFSKKFLACSIMTLGSSCKILLIFYRFLIHQFKCF